MTRFRVPQGKKIGFAGRGLAWPLVWFWSVLALALAPGAVFAIQPLQSAMAMQAGEVRANADGTYSVDLELRIQNVGEEPVVDVQIDHRIGQQLSPAVLVGVSNLSVSGALTEVNPGFNGISDYYLLPGTGRLEPGEEAVALFTATFDAAGHPGPFSTQSMSWVRGEVSRIGNDDLSENGPDPDPDTIGNRPIDNPNPGDDLTPTPIVLPGSPAVPAIGLAKRATPTRNLLPGEYTLRSGADAATEYTFVTELQFVVANIGPTALAQVQVRDRLNQTFPPPANFLVLEAPVASLGLAANPNFSGNSDSSLLLGHDILASGDSGTIAVVVGFNAGGLDGPFLNTALATAEDVETGQPVEDQSDDGSVPDFDGDGNANEPGENDLTPILVPVVNPSTSVPLIGLAKSAGEVTRDPANASQWQVEFTFTLANLGDVELQAVQLTDDLAATFADANAWQVDGPVTTTNGLVANPNFDGLPGGDTRLLEANSSQLDVGASATVSVRVLFAPADLEQVFNNTAVATGTSPEGEITEDRSTDGLQPDPNGDGDPQEQIPTPVVTPPVTPEVGPSVGSLGGTVFFDPDHNDLLGSGESGLAGWVVTVRDANGDIVAEVITAADGTYNVPDLPAGDYSVDFAHPDTGVVWQVSEVTVPVGGRAQADLPVDPSGRVYDSITRDLVPDVELQLVRADNGQVLPDACLLPGQQNQRIGADAAYRFDVQFGAAPACPASLATYRIEILTVPSLYLASPSTIIPSEIGSLAVGSCEVDSNSQPPCVVQDNNLPPTGGQATGYFLEFAVGSVTETLVNNHIPLDRPRALAPDANLVNIQKFVNVSVVSVGDLVGYRVRLQNLTGGDLAAISLEDDLPPGFAFVEGSLQLADPGPDAQFGTADDLRTPLASSGIDPVTFGPFDLPANAAREITYTARVGVGVTAGDFTNRITPFQAAKIIGADAIATVQVTADPIFDNSTIIGKVFQDRDGDAWQDSAVASGLVLSGGPFDKAVKVPNMRGRLAATDPPLRVQMKLPANADESLSWAQPVLLRSAQGSRVTLAESGELVHEHVGAVAAGRSGQHLHMHIEAQGQGRVLVIENRGIEERGLPGMRLATVSGLLIETDSVGRFHIADVDTGSTNRGANFILKLDTASLPDGAEVISENPRVLRLTQALMSRIDFAVRLPETPMVAAPTSPGQMLQIVTRQQTANIEPVHFGTGRIDIPANYQTQLKALLTSYADKDNLQLTFVGHADPRLLKGRLQREFGDNLGLSAARAAQVAEFVQTTLGLPPELVRSEGRGAREPVASNATRAGLAANRRVEIELSWTDVEEKEIKVLAGSAAPALGVQEISYARTQKLPALSFRSGSAELDEASLAQIRRVIAQHGKDKVSLALTGHTDNVPVGEAMQSRYATNEALSLARAQQVSKQLQREFGLSADAISTQGMGAQQPIASNATERGRLANRRVDIAVTAQVSERREHRWLKPVQRAVTEYLPHSGRIWASEQPLMITPKLNVLASDPGLVAANGDLLEAPTFATYNNYSEFITRQELRLFGAYDTDLADPLAVVAIDSGTAGPISLPSAAQEALRGYLASAALNGRVSTEIGYVLRAYGSSSANAGDDEVVFDETAVRRLLLPHQRAARRSQSQQAPSVWGQSNLSLQRIQAQGSRVRLHGIDVDPAMSLQVNGQTVPVSQEGNFLWEQQLAVGEHLIAVDLTDTQGKVHSREVPVTVDGNYQFMVGLANLTVGQNSLHGSLEPLSNNDHFDESVFVDGRIALYAKAKVRGRYLITAQLDSTEDELKNFGDNLRREDPRRLFRQLDPDRYYPVYGDDSTTVTDVDTQGAFYVRVDWDHSSALWGNYNTGLTDTEFTQYNRSLYGAKLAHKSQATTQYGDAKRSLTVFGSEAQSAAAHVSFAATGGSLYYLKHTDIVQGSEKVWIEVRRRDSEQVLDREVLEEGRDYEVDALQGRIILSRPLSQVVNDRGPAIVRSTPLEGDNVFLLVDYEYVPDAFAAEELTAGGRGKVWLGDHVAVGASKVIDERSGTDYDLQGVDVTLKAGQGTYLKAEYAESEAQQNLANYASTDGGLSFATQSSTAGPGLEGEALALEARVNFADLNTGDRKLDGEIRAWWKDRDADFSAGRLAQGVATTDAGVDLRLQLNAQTQLMAGYSELDRDDIGTDRVARLQLDSSMGRWELGLEGRYEEIKRTAGLPVGPSVLSGRTGDGEALLFGARLGYQLNTRSQLYVTTQRSANEDGNYADNDLVSVGVSTELSERLAVSLELSDGDRGSAVTGGLEIAATNGLNLNIKGGFGSGAISEFGTRYSYGEGHEVYGSYAVDPDRTEGARDTLTLGQRRQWGNNTRVFTETQFGKDDIYASSAHVFGLDYSGIQDWLFTTTVQQSDNETLGLDFERTAVSLGARLERDSYRFSSRIELREDEASGLHTRQYLTSNSFTWRPSANRRWLALLNWSWTDDELAREHDAKFIEFDLGYAYRPVWTNRLNVLAKYSYLFDLPGEAQLPLRTDQRAHIFSTEALFDLNQRWELGGKLAFKKGEQRFSRDSGRWENFGLRLLAIRARYHLTNRWDGLAEYRWLSDYDGDSTRHGALLGAYRHVGKNLKLGVGYNFAGFDDDLKLEDYDSHGWFIDLIGKY